ncbi:MAG: hypothetical protein IT178_03605 [Acidobacteria bacterium]|nr:hypothetical protein [Acidobacteriota bacterium]
MADHYSPERRTAVVLTGTGADGAYHAGVLRALQETGIKVDIVAGRGIGALGAVLFAIDGASGLWEAGGPWSGATPQRFYRWRWPFRSLQGLLWTVLAILLVPIAVLAILTLVYLLALGVGLTGLSTGEAFAATMRGLLEGAFAPARLPTWIPRLMLLVALIGLSVLAIGLGVEMRGQAVQRTTTARAWWALLGAPIDVALVRRAANQALWNILRGGAALGVPDRRDLSRRYADLLAENIGHPGFRELLLVAHDLDARRDMVFGLLREPYRKALFAAATAAADRRAEAHDLAGVAREHVVDVLGAALTLPGVCPPQMVTFTPEAFWRGESHRLADRPSCLARLIEEAAAAGAEQLIVIAGVAGAARPHELRPARLDGLGQVADHLASAESVAVADALRHLQHQFQGTYLIRPGHNPVRPLDMAGAHDERSDRHHSLEELMHRGYEDAFHQFIEPMLGASGERL